MLFVAVSLANFAGAAEPPGAPPPATQREMGDAEQLVFLLQYVGSDYAGAVRDGRVVDEAEYRENREFAALIAERFAHLRSAIPPAKVAALETAVAKLRELVDARADPRLVREITEAAIPRLVEALDLRSFPRERPDPRRASALYADNCAPCHGARGGGDGPRAKEFDPPPARFTDPERLNATAPYVFYNAITLGVANTAMASFAEALSDQERWDLAFYIWTFIVPDRGALEPSPSPAARQVVLSLRDLATRTSLEVAPEVIRQAAAHGEMIDREEACQRVARLRVHPPPLSDAEERLARLRQDLVRSVSLVEHGDSDAAADVVTTAYLSDFEPLEPELDRRDRQVRQDFERGLIEFRTALRRSDTKAALATARMLESTVDRAATVLAPRASGGGPGTMLAITALIVAAGAVAVRRIGKLRRVS